MFHTKFTTENPRYIAYVVDAKGNNKEVARENVKAAAWHAAKVRAGEGENISLYDRGANEGRGGMIHDLKFVGPYAAVGAQYLLVYPNSGLLAHPAAFVSAKAAKDFQEECVPHAVCERVAVMTRKQWQKHLDNAQREA